MARGQAHKEATRAAVIAALLAGQAIAEVAREFSLPESTVRNWGKASPQFAEYDAKKGERIADLTFELLESILVGVRAGIQVVMTSEYLSKQPASEAAVLLGVVADKGFRLLSALPSGESGIDSGSAPVAADE